MLLIADSGSTKTDWRLFDKNHHIHDIVTMGMNPYFVTSHDILQAMKKDLHPYFDKDQIKEVYFYGSGCTHKDKILEVESALSEFFSKAVINIESDLLGTARAVCGDSPGIAGILGTGSNSCLYDGQKIISQLFSLGYVLGDEGSGAVLGKKILKSAFSGNMPAHLQEDFRKSYPESADSMLSKIYSKPFPNRFLASFAPFAILRMEDEWMKRLLRDHLNEFFMHMVAIYPEYQKYSLSLSGSVAWHLRLLIEEICSDIQMQPGKIIQRPVEELTAYHVRHLV